MKITVSFHVQLILNLLMLPKLDAEAYSKHLVYVSIICIAMNSYK